MRVDCARGARCYDTVGGPRPPGTSNPPGSTVGRPPAPRPPAPPPPPPWVTNALIPLARAAAGQMARQELDPVVELHPTFGQTDQIFDIIDKNTVITKDGFTHAVEIPDIAGMGEDSEEEKDCLNGEFTSSVVWYGPLKDNHATGVVACLTELRGTKTREAYPELTGYNAQCKLANAHGHLLAHCLGGLDIRENFVPINHNATNVSQMWHGVEKQIKNALAKDETIYYQVIPHFPEDQALIDQFGVGVPDYIDIYAKGDKGFECSAVIHNVAVKPSKYKGCRQ
jgi:hypothetical protein